MKMDEHLGSLIVFDRFLEKPEKLRKPKKGRCYFCHKRVNADTYCFGCRHSICGDCDHSAKFLASWQRFHHVDAHRKCPTCGEVPRART